MASFRSAAERLYRRLLSLYPGDFRGEYGDEMALLFRDRSRDEPLSRLLIDVAFDTLTTAPREHVAMWKQDVRYAARLMARNPGFTLVAAGSLALGIGANAAIFSLADAMLLRPLAVARPSEVVSVRARSQKEGAFDVSYSSTSFKDYLDFRDRSRSFDGLVAFDEVSVGLAARADALPRLTFGLLVSGNFFRTFGVEPALGRGFRPEEDEAPGRDAVAVLSYATWETAFGSDPEVLGRTIRLNGVPLTVVGVAPAAFPGMDPYVRPAVYAPLMMAPALLGPSGERLLERRDERRLRVKGRLRSGVGPAQAEAELATLARQLEESHPDTNKNQGVAVRTELQSRVEMAPDDAKIAALLMALVALVLLIACANVANLLLSRSGARAREIAVRLALGAGRARLVRQLVTESLLLALLGGALGLILAFAGVRFFSGVPMPTDLPVVLDVQLDYRVLLFSFGASVLSVLAFGLAPALQATRADLVSSLKAGDAGVVTKGRTRGAPVLVVAQVALSLVLLVAATSLTRGVERLTLADPGFRRQGLLMASFDASVLRYAPEKTRAFYRELVERATSLPGVKSVALTNEIPMGNSWSSTDFVPEGYVLPEGKQTLSAFDNVVDPRYFETFAVPIVKGRAFNDADREDSRRVAIVNEAAAQAYWPGQDPIGKRMRLLGPEGPWAEVVGVAKTHKYMWVGEAPMEFLYFPFAQAHRQEMTVLLETGGDAAALAGPLRELVRSVDPAMPIHDVRTMDEFFNLRAVKLPGMIVQTVGSMGLVGLALALVGLYGLMAYSVSRRTREIGIRMAIGAARRDVLVLVVRQGLGLSAVGIGIGLVASVAVSRSLAAIVTGVAPADPVAFLVVPAALLAVTLLATLLPARRAARVDPVKALRFE